MPHTVIAPDLLAAYRKTLYVVQTPSPFTLKVGEASPELRQWMQGHACHCAVFLTACNPYSQALNDAENAQRQRALEQEILRRNLPWAHGLGQPQEGQWKPEPSYLVGGLALDEGRTLGRRFEQNALLWCGQDTLVQLILLR